MDTPLKMVMEPWPMQKCWRMHWISNIDSASGKQVVFMGEVYDVIQKLKARKPHLNIGTDSSDTFLFANTNLTQEDAQKINVLVQKACWKQLGRDFNYMRAAR